MDEDQFGQPRVHSFVEGHRDAPRFQKIWTPRAVGWKVAGVRGHTFDRLILR